MAVRPVPVYLETAPEPSQALMQVLEAADFFSHIRRVTGDLEPAGVRIAIKPNMMGAGGRPTSGAQTDPRLVESLVGALRARGYEQIAVVESRLAGGRSVAEVAAALGYRGQGYAIVDLSADPIEFDYGGVLGRSPAGRAWVEADARITFAKNKTDGRYLFSGSMANVMGVLPEPDKRRAYAGAGHRPEECVRTALDALPVAFALLDAWQSRDADGVRATGTIMASVSPFALDWVMGEKMGIDPALNPVIQEGLHRWGRIELERTGNLMPWDPWRSPSNLSVVLDRALEGGRGGRWTIQ